MSDPEIHIQYLPHEAINKPLWDACIAKALNGLIYASSTYLDAMSAQWDALVLGNYEAVMPLTWRSKMGIRYICMPAFTQQLGLFITQEHHAALLPIFLQKISVRFRLIDLQLNFANQTDHVLLHNNYVLRLHQSYAHTRAGYKTDLLKNLKRTEKFSLQYGTSQDAVLAIQLFEQQYANRIGVRKQDFEYFTRLVKTLLGKNAAIIRKVTTQTGELLAIGVFAKDDKRIYNLASTTLPNGRMMEANHFLFDQLIREFSESGLILDFEGSDQPGIARFYHKFGSTNEPYFGWRINRLPAIARWWKR
jgi:hypothetical protein